MLWASVFLAALLARVLCTNVALKAKVDTELARMVDDLKGAPKDHRYAPYFQGLVAKLEGEAGKNASAVAQLLLSSAQVPSFKLYTQRQLDTLEAAMHDCPLRHRSKEFARVVWEWRGTRDLTDTTSIVGFFGAIVYPKGSDEVRDRTTGSRLREHALLAKAVLIAMKEDDAQALGVIVPHLEHYLQQSKRLFRQQVSSISDRSEALEGLIDDFLEAVAEYRRPLYKSSEFWAIVVALLAVFGSSIGLYYWMARVPQC